jgi:hypothetical protein
MPAADQRSSSSANSDQFAISALFPKKFVVFTRNGASTTIDLLSCRQQQSTTHLNNNVSAAASPNSFIQA